MTTPQPLPGPAISGAFLTIGEMTYVRHGGLWVPLDVPRIDWDALADAAFEATERGRVEYDFEEERAT